MLSELTSLLPEWATGHITGSEARFLAALVDACDPETVVEIGVASGVSSAVLLRALAARPSRTARLFSFDVAERCYFDHSRRVGDAVREMSPELMDRWTLTIGDVAHAERLLRGHAIPLTFIDANHCHPWPAIDLMGLLPICAPGAWVVLHDVRMAETFGPTAPFNHLGAEYLFDAWPWAKKRDGNIGAVRLDGTRREMFDICFNLLDTPWETTIDGRYLFELCARHGEGGANDDVPWTTRLIKGLRRMADGGRDIVLWGAGKGGQQFLQHLRADGVIVSGVLDRDPHKIGQQLDGIEIRSPYDLQGPRKPFVVICSIFGQSIAADLEEVGFIHGRDFITA